MAGRAHPSGKSGIFPLGRAHSESLAPLGSGAPALPFRASAHWTRDAALRLGGTAQRKYGRAPWKREAALWIRAPALSNRGPAHWFCNAAL